MSSFRLYVYGVTEKGSREFLITTLAKSDAERYIEDHAKIFPDRYVEYQIGTPLELFDNVEDALI